MMGVRIRERDGAWWVFVNHKGQRKAKRIGIGTVGKRAAEDVAKKIEASLALGTRWDGPTKITITDYAEKWLHSYAAVACKPRTYELYESMFRVHILPVLGKVFLSDLRRDQIRELLAEKSRAGLKLGTLKNILAPLRGMLNQAVEDDLIPKNPANGMGKFLAKQRDKRDTGRRTDFYTEPELRQLLITAETEFSHDRELVHTAAWTGMRAGELFGLQWSDIEFHQNFVEVQRTVGYRKGALNIGSPKSGKSRRVDLPAILADRLKVRYEKAKEKAALSEAAFIPWVFPNRSDKPQDASHFTSRVWHPLLAKAGLRRLPLHTLRHSYASHLIMRGESLAYVKEQLGHSSIQVTVDLYGHLVPGLNKGAVNALAEATKCNLPATEAGERETEEPEVIEKIGGPCRGRTYGPLIKSANKAFFIRFAVATVFPLFAYGTAA